MDEHREYGEEQRTPEQSGEYGEEERVPEHSGTSHALAIGFYIATIVLVFGVTLTLTGLLAPGLRAKGDLGINVNLVWGIVMVVSGCVILGLSLASPRRRAARRSE